MATTTSENSIERATGDQSVPMPSGALLNIAQCCRNSATMLRVADSGEPDADKRLRYGKANEGQARLLVEAAKILERAAEGRSAS